MNGIGDLPLAFVCGHRKSGTTLLANLLDGHPQLAVYPVDLVLLYAYFPDFIRKHMPIRRERRARLETHSVRRSAAAARCRAARCRRAGARFFDGLRDDDLGAPIS